MPDSLKGEDTFGADHYRPQRFVLYRNRYDNLFYACNGCNRRKHDFWPTRAQFAAKQYIVNPCEDVMFAHLRFNGSKVASRSTQGEWTSDALELNDEDVVAVRETILMSIQTCEARRDKARGSMALAEKTLKKADTQTDIAALTRLVGTFRREIEKCTRVIDRLTGEWAE
jgi:hypothetical protein